MRLRHEFYAVADNFGTRRNVGWVEQKMRVLRALFLRNPSTPHRSTMGFGKTREERTRFTSTHPTSLLSRLRLKTLGLHHLCGFRRLQELEKRLGGVALFRRAAHCRRKVRVVLVLSRQRPDEVSTSHGN